MDDTTWVDAMAVDELPRDDVWGIVVAGRAIAVCTVGDVVYALDDGCTHGAARLCEGFLEGHELECPLHQGRFDVRDGRPTCAPAVDPVPTYPVRIDGDRVYLKLD